jgi:hypothetical protein
VERTTLRDRSGRKLWHWCHAYAVFAESVSGREISPREPGELYMTIKPIGPGEVKMDIVFIPENGVNGRLDHRLTERQKLHRPPVCRIHDAEDDELLYSMEFGTAQPGDNLTIDFGQDLHRILP